MRYRAMAKHFLFEAAVRAAQDASVREGQYLEPGRDLTEAEMRHFRAALEAELRVQQRVLENAGVLESGNLPVQVAA